MKLRATPTGLMIAVGAISLIAAVTCAVVLPGDAAAGSGPSEGTTAPDTVLTHVLSNTGAWTPEEMDQAEPMPLLSPDHPAGPGSGGPSAAGRTATGNPAPPSPVG